MQTKVTATLLLATTALLVSAGCSHPAATPPPAAVPTNNPNPVAPTDAASKALSNPNTPPDVKKYLSEHQGQIPKSAGGQ